MISLLLLVFLVQLTTQLFSSVGVATTNEIAWILYNKLPTKTSQSVQEQTKLQREILRMKKEMNAVSAQDEFARWARLRRQHDDVVAKYENISSSLSSTKTSFDRTVALLRWIATTGLRFLLQTYYQREPMFWIPAGWLPYYVEWILSFPRAPLGSVSIQVWSMACSSIITLVGEALVGVWSLATSKKSGMQSKGSARRAQAYGPSSSARQAAAKKDQ
ncbi:protein get1 [Lineolata rhizophorae]|uniref:Protein get1 n=1 Tax=Lineolata rhizophorae TaxID=578093 RepID=A0A6A6PBM8_9PEZI|nr:protein get1 [Lineolata rhizophorae]